MKLGWEPSLQFEEGFEETVKWYLENQEWMESCYFLGVSEVL